MTFDTLIKSVDNGIEAKKYENYYEGKVRLDAIGINLPPRVRLLEMVAPFPKLAIDVLAEVLVPDGFVLGDDEATPAALSQIWQANNLDSLCNRAIVDALVQRQVFWVVGPGKDPAIPRITVHGRQGFAIAYDAVGGVTEALRRYQVNGSTYACHYLPGLNRYYVLNQARQWVIAQDDIVTGLDAPAVVPMANRVRLGDVDGRSEIAEIAGISDAASRTLTTGQIAQEMTAAPLKYLLGDIDDQTADRLSAYIGSFITGPEGATMGYIPGSDLSPFHNSYKLYAQMLSSITGIPPQMLGVSTDNPASAEAMRVAKDRLISRAERKAAMFGDALEDVARMALQMAGKLPADAETLELRWRDPAMASESARATFALQAYQAGIIGAQTAREFLRLTPAQMAREAARSSDGDIARAQLGG